MKNEMLYSKDSLDAAHQIQSAAQAMNHTIYAMKALGIPAGEGLEHIRDEISTLAKECSDHLMKEQHEQLQNTQDQTWNLVGAVFADAASKIK
ncbi:hypothetical protein VPBG_00094 [Vibrio phage helene 12B3]|uniref:hypothetical protein n=1 Tax=Vibrio phage helene 12B3 TaxID=573173 RepID=UPI0002C0A8D7|nr:hypothetical protein VPBG_00094 [Vibrio phage helene 12B3]AGG57866.1 hypothetical protein VPBG_00094 [Vibrio phage helene 12B3]